MCLEVILGILGTFKIFLVAATVCPSGLRGWTQVPAAKAAWVNLTAVMAASAVGLRATRRQTWTFTFQPLFSQYNAKLSSAMET